MSNIASSNVTSQTILCLNQLNARFGFITCGLESLRHACQPKKKKKSPLIMITIRKGDTNLCGTGSLVLSRRFRLYYVSLFPRGWGSLGSRGSIMAIACSYLVSAPCMSISTTYGVLYLVAKAYLLPYSVLNDFFSLVKCKRVLDSIDLR